MDCPRCGSINYRKDGFVISRQRSPCKECRYLYTVAKKSDVKSTVIRRMVLELYLEGCGFRTIGRLLQISYGMVYAWIKKWGLKRICPRRKQELHLWNSMRCIRILVQTNYSWIWIAVDRLGKRFVGFVSVDRSTQTVLKLGEEIKHIPVSFYCWDY
ncbi:hypothetical protein EZS27_029164 [termite gut metagenome]|uniref:InsA N-terminal domain-containing protein n=1 Tax=termite gut metagenome TaxID=433724 RepID=A0A5J4QHZ1_9ZZZZ